jgi:glycosyltransferase involved in cell wall biosynthesis
LTVESLRRDRPGLAARVCYLPAGITLGSDSWPWRERLAAAPGELLCLCPAGIRPVKGVLELIGMCESLIVEGCRLRLVFCGPILDDDYGRRFLAAVSARPWTTYLGVVPPAAMPAALRQADVILSNSFGEGLPNALVEAAAVGRPVLARDIPGNAAVVSDGDNGLLYRDEHGFRTALQRLHDDPALRATLSRPSPERFSAEREAATLEALCHEILASFANSRPRQG